MRNKGFFSISHASEQKKQEIIASDQVYRKKSKAVQEATRRQKNYQLKQSATMAELNAQTQRTSHEKKYHLKAVRDVIRERIRNRSVYAKYDRLVSSPDSNPARYLPFHHSRGTRVVDAGGNALSIDCAGSSFKQFRKEHTGFHGKGDEDQGQHFRDVYGKTEELTVGDKTTHVYRKDKAAGASTRYTISGPGMINSGEFSMDNIRDYVFALGSSYIRDILESGAWKVGPPWPIEVNIQGHSRGAVAASTGIDLLMKHVAQTYPQYAQYIRFNLIQHDAVPGLGSADGLHGKIDFRHTPVNATTVCSIQSDHTFAFSPQEIRGQSRIILMADKHGVGLDEGDDTQKDAEGEKKYHRKAAVDASNMEVYRSTGLSDMAKGVFIQDENGAVIRLRSYGEAMDIVTGVRKFAIGQSERAAIVARMIKNWFIDNDYVDDTMTGEELRAAHEEAEETAAKLLKSRWGGKDSETMKELKTKIRDLRGALSGVPGDQAAFDQKKSLITGLYGAAIESCRKYMENRDPSTPTGRERLSMVGKLLSQYRAELAALQKVNYDSYAGQDAPDFSMIFGKQANFDFGM